MATFEELVKELLEEEGRDAVTNDPNDSGGLTKWGISQKAYPNLDIENLTEEEAKQIYKRDYWNKMKLGSMPAHLRKDLFFAGVNMGIRNPVNRALQKIVGAKPDGVIGKNTVEKIKNFEGVDQINRQILVEGAIDYYADLAKRRPKDRKYLNGWMNRVVDPVNRPFGSQNIDLRKMDIDQIKQIARQQLPSPEQQQRMTTVEHHRPSPVREQAPNLPEGFTDQFMAMFQEITKASQARSQEVSAPLTEDTEVQPTESEEEAAARGFTEAENKLIEAAVAAPTNDVVGGARPDSEFTDAELNLINRAVGTTETEEPVFADTTEEAGDGTRDPIYGIF